MIRLLSLMLLGASTIAFSASTSLRAADEEVKLEGTICCGKCELKMSEKCAVTIVVAGKDGKKTTYWFDKDAHKKYHDDVCQETKAGTVTGTVKKDGEKMIITVKDLKYKK